MKVSTKGRYALRIMLDLAMHDSKERMPLKSIAQRQDITLKYMEQVIAPLAKAGFVVSLRGANGGYRLAKSPSEFTCGEIIRAVEGPLEPTACLENGRVIIDCARADNCPTIDFWRGLSQVINDYVDSVTLQDLVDRQSAMADDYVI